MAERLHCCVPHCTRSKAPDPEIGEWVCPLHWKGIKRSLRQVFIRAKKRHRADPTPEHQARLGLIWERCKSMAIEHAAGLL